MRSLDDILSALPGDRRARIQRKAKRLVRAEALRQLRELAKKTQVDVAREVGISQHAVSRLESRDDMLLSTLSAYVGGLGGKLHLIAELPGSDPIELDLARPRSREPAE